MQKLDKRGKSDDVNSIHFGTNSCVCVHVCVLVCVAPHMVMMKGAHATILKAVLSVLVRWDTLVMVLKKAVKVSTCLK